MLRRNTSIENENSSHRYMKNSPINIRDALYEGRTEATKTLQSRGRREDPLCERYKQVNLHL